MDAFELDWVHQQREVREEAYEAEIASLRAEVDRLRAELAETAPRSLAASRPPTLWAVPPQPAEDVLAVVDRFGQRFERGTAYNDDGTEEEVWVGTLFADATDDGEVGWEEVPDLHLTWDSLIRNHSPLALAASREGTPLAEPETTGEPWRCARCGSNHWVAASLTGPVSEGGRAIRQCVPCGHYSADAASGEETRTDA